jgi:hypothetical protein
VWSRRTRSATTSVWTLHKGEHAAATDLKAVPGIGAEIVLTVGGELRNATVPVSPAGRTLVGAIADTRTMFERTGCA